MTDISDTIAEALEVSADGSIASSIDVVGDRDVFKVTVSSTHILLVNAGGDPGNGTALADPFVTLYNSSGSEIDFDDNSGAGANAFLMGTSLFPDTYYIAVSSADGGTGDYLLTLAGNDIADSTATSAALRLDVPLTGYIANASDQDFYAINLEAGVSYRFVLSGTGLDDSSTALSTPYLQMRDGTGLVAQGTNALLYTPEKDGVAWVSATSGSFGNGYFDLSATVVTAPDIPEHSPVDAIDWFDYIAPTTIRVLFAAGGTALEDTYEGIPNGPFTAVGWTTGEIAAAEAAFHSFEAVANVHFEFVTDIGDADFVLAKNADTENSNIEGNDGYWDVGGASLAYGHVDYDVQGVGVFNTDSDGNGTAGSAGDFWNDAALLPGGYAYAVLLHEIGHGMGLAHPHDHGGGSEIMDGVTASNSLGDYELNQGVFTAMTYNYGWYTEPGAPAWEPGPEGLVPGPGTWDYGWQASPMALDIAALQRKYGANADHNDGDDTYTLPGDNASGTGFAAIWDTGGTDTIRYAGASNVVISLIAATLDYSWAGGGRVSYANGIHGGFTIAAGVVIENASGGNGDDWLIGNDAANVLDGGAGEDTADYSWQEHAVSVTLEGANDAIATVAGVGTDILRGIEDLAGSTGDDTLTGDAGDNWLTGYYGDDTLDGSDGNDWANYGDFSDDVVVTLSGATFAGVSVGGRIEDQIRNIENVQGGDGYDTLSGDGLDNKLVGAGGDDVLRGGVGADTLDGGAGDHDRADFSDRTAGIVLTLNRAASIDVTVGGSIEDHLLNIEDVTGSNFADHLTGDGKNNRFTGGAGKDVLDGKNGAFDVADYSDRALAVSVHLDTSHFADVKVGGVKEDKVANIEAIYGSSRADSLIGDSKDNFFRGMAGKDVLDGGRGAHDTADYTEKTARIEVKLNGAHKVTVKVGGHAEDSLKNIEDVNGGSAADKLTGDSHANEIYGMVGNDTLHGGAGKDVLSGGAGNDRFVFDASLGHAGADTIRDFSHRHDKIGLDNAVMAALGSKTGTLSSSKFYAHSGASHGHDSSDRVVYDTHSGKLYYDANGSHSGGVTQIAVLTGHPTLSASDFLIV